MTSLSRCWLLLLLTTVAIGQAGVGARIPGAAMPLHAGGALVWEGDAAPLVTVLAFHRSLAAASSQADFLRCLVKAHQQAVRVVVVAPVTDAETWIGPLRDIGVVADDAGSLRTVWLGAGDGFEVVVVRSGRVVWTGETEHGLRRVVARAVAGLLEVEIEAKLTTRRLLLRDTLLDSDGATVRAQAQQLLAHEPADGFAWGVLYLAQAEMLVDRAAASEVLGRAVLALTDEPQALGAFADLVLRGSPNDPALGRELVPPLTAAAVTVVDDLSVQLARLRALVRAGGGREVGRSSQRLARRIEQDWRLALEFVDILTKDRLAAVYKDLCQRALTLAAERGADPRLLAAAQYVVALHVDEDPARAERIAADYFATIGSRVQMNNDAWYLMTESATRGRFDGFALAMVERMLEQRAAMDYFEFDTAALAMFRAGRVDEAIELQTVAIDKGGRGNGVYQERLQRYRAAAGATPR